MFETKYELTLGTEVLHLKQALLMRPYPSANTHVFNDSDILLTYAFLLTRPSLSYKNNRGCFHFYCNDWHQFQRC